MALSQLLFIPCALPKVNRAHLLPVVITCLLPYIFTFKAVQSTGSFITKQNHKLEGRRYPYDHILYQENRTCATCHFTKPARSKHCSICNACVSKSDHHCVWLMNCLGKGNYVYFVGLMGALGLMLSYGVFLAYLVLSQRLEADHLHVSSSATGRRSWSNGLIWSESMGVWRSTISRDFRVGAVGLLALFMAPLAWCLFGYHLYLIWAGMTTNETSKWGSWKDDISQGLVYKKQRSQMDRHSEANIRNGVQWPKHTEYRFRRQSYDSLQDENNRNMLMKRGWTEVRSLAELENLYDLGFWANLGDVL